MLVKEIRCPSEGGVVWHLALELGPVTLEVSRRPVGHFYHYVSLWAAFSDVHPVTAAALEAAVVRLLGVGRRDQRQKEKRRSKGHGHGAGEHVVVRTLFSTRC